jgi:hypothetical protein
MRPSHTPIFPPSSLRQGFDRQACPATGSSNDLHNKASLVCYMNYRSILLITTLVIVCPSCKKTVSTVSSKSDESSETASQQAFSTQKFATFDGSKTILIISEEELEIARGSEILVCKYTQQERKLRVIFNVSGTVQASYFQITSDGLEDSNGTVYFNPQKLQRVHERIRHTLAVANARQISHSLFEFENKFGAYPNEKTAAQVKTSSGTTASVKAVTANDCFFQLIAANIAQTDQIFSLDNQAVPELPAKHKQLEKLSKCSFAYLSMDSAGSSFRPWVVCPLVKGKTTFDPQALGGKAVILKLDCSVDSLPIEPDGRVLIDGKDIFDPSQPFWEGKVPDIKWPEG